MLTCELAQTKIETRIQRSKKKKRCLNPSRRNKPLLGTATPEISCHSSSRNNNNSCSSNPNSKLLSSSSLRTNLGPSSTKFPNVLRATGPLLFESLVSKTGQKVALGRRTVHWKSRSSLIWKLRLIFMPGSRVMLQLDWCRAIPYLLSWAREEEC